jgi:hypothetical protein
MVDPALGRDWRLLSESQINTKMWDLSRPQEDKGSNPKWRISFLRGDLDVVFTFRTWCYCR